MKKIILFLFLIIVIAAGAAASWKLFDLSATSQSILSSIPIPLFLTPKQYFGATVDMSQVLPESQHYVKNNKGQDLIDIASTFKMNTLRITNITSIADTPTSSYTHKQWQEVLGKMESKNIYAVILIEANAQDTNFDRVNLNDYYINFVKNYIIKPNLCSFSNIIAVDIANEPLLNKANLAKMRQAADMIKSSCPSMKITIGSWRTDSGQKDSSGEIYYWHDPKEVKQIENIVDIDSVHIYGFDKPVGGPYPDPYTLTTGYLKEVRKYTDKPIFIEEFGAGNGDELTDQNTLGSPELQQNAYQGVLKAAYDMRNKGVLGGTAYLLYPRTDGPDSWSITKDNANTILPAAYTFKSIPQK